MSAQLVRVELLAVEVGRLRRSVEPGTGLAHLADRMADHVESLALMLQPSAAELAAASYPGDSEAIDAAIEFVDRRAASLRGLLGLERAA